MLALKEQKRICGEAWTELSPAERSDLMLIHAEAKKEHVSIRDLWTMFRTGKLDNSPAQRRTLAEAITETVAAKMAENEATIC